MKTSCLVLALLGFALTTLAQQPNKKKQAEAVIEGYVLYHSELASWHASDMFLQNFPELQEQAGGYFSYATPQGTRCVFYSKEPNPKVLVTITFGKEPKPAGAKTNSTPRPLTAQETELRAIREATMAAIQSDTLYQAYSNTQFNIVPLSDGKSRKAYVLTGPQVGGTVILGNDYLLTFDKSYRISSQRKLHQNIIPVEFAAAASDNIDTMHSHLPATGDYMTPTDICTLLLYGKMSNWRNHITMSQNFISIWEVPRGQLTMLSRTAWEKMMNHQQEKQQL